MKDNNFGVALVKRACPICCKLFDAEIVMNSILTPKHAKQVKDLNGKCVGYLEEPCDECKEQYTSKGFTFIAVDESKSNKNNPYRTGKIVVVEKESELVKDICKNNDYPNDYAFIDEELGKQLGIF